MQANSRSLPPFPEELRHVWWCFSQLAGTRPVGPVIGPITYAEIAEFNRATLAGLTAWEVRLIRRLDDRVRSVALGEANPTSQISARDGGGVATMLRGLAKRKKKGGADG